MTGLSEGWIKRRLGDVCDVQGGRTPNKLEARLAASPRADRTIPFYKVGDMSGDPRYLSAARVVFAPDESQLFGMILAKTGSVVFPKAGGAIATNKKRAVRVEGAIDLNCMAVTAGPAVIADYLYWWFQQIDLRALSDGSILPQLSKKTICALEIPTPDLDEQQRIVDILEDHLSRLDAGMKGLSSALVKAKQMVGALREQAVALAAINTPLAEIASIQGGIQKQPKRRPQSNSAPFLRVANVTALGLDLNEIHEIELFEGEIERYRLEAGDLLVVEGNGSPSQIGRAAVWTGEIANCVHQNHLIRVRPSTAVNPKFLEIIWNAPSTRKRITALSSSTSGLHTLSVGKLKALQISVPFLEVQQQFVEAFEAEVERLNRLMEATETQIARGRALRRSLLDAAFAGRLSGDLAGISSV